MTDKKETFKDKLKGVFIAKVLGIAGLIIMSLWNFFADTFQEGANVKFNDRVTVVIHAEKDWFIDLINDAIDSTMNDTFTFLDVLSSDHIKKFAESEAENIKRHVRKEIMHNDSIRGSVATELGSQSGYRDEDVLKELGKMLKAWKDGQISTVRRVTASF